MSGEGKYRTIVADPPWPHPSSGPRTRQQSDGPRVWRAGTRSELPYERMTVAEIAALPVREQAEADAHLYLWTTNGFLRSAFDVVDAWGFKFSTVLTWCKTPMGLGPGGAYAVTTEFVLFARRGSLPPLRRWDSTWFPFKRVMANGSVAHSAKPDAFLDTVEQVSPGPYLELFARRARFGWKYWGDQSLGTAEMPEVTHA